MLSLNYLTKSAVLLGILFLWACHCKARQPEHGTFRIKGRVVDSATGKAVDYAAVTVLLKGSTNVAGGAIADDNGYFTIDDLGSGEYTLKVDFVSYTTRTIPGITLDQGHALAGMGNIKLASRSKILADVTVSDTRNYIENHLDKLVYNAERDASSQGGLATDVLKKVPLVDVDLDGNVSLLGDNNVRVFINGKPSATFDNNLAEALKSIPANQIKSIEVITSPGAQYDAQGTAGIINIVLKDNKIKGINGNASASGGTRYENGNVNVHIKNGGLDLSASFGANAQLDTKTLIGLDRTTDRARLLQSGYNTTKRNGYRPALGFDWAVNKHDDINGGASYNNFGNSGGGYIAQQQFSDLTDTQTATSSANAYRYFGSDWNLNYKHKFGKEGQELNFSYQGGYGTSTFYYSQDQKYLGDDSLFAGAKGNNGFRDHENLFSADYAHPFAPDVTLNVGVRASLSRIQSNSYHYALSAADTFSGTPFQYNEFNFNRDVYAAYASMAFPINKKYSLKFGVRDEYTINSTPGDTLNIASDNFVTPSATLARTLNGNQTIKLSYSRRIQRPGYGQYNPFVNASDPVNLSTGYPAILPQKLHSGELSYYKFWEHGSNVLVTLYYRYSADDWQGYSTFHPFFMVGDSLYRNVTVSTTINAATQQTAGINLSTSWVVNSKLQIRPSISLHQKYFQSDSLPSGHASNFSYRGNINITYQFDKTLMAEFYGGYHSVRYEVQGKFPSFANYSIAVKKQFRDKKSTLTFSATDPFNTYTNQVSYINSSNFSSVSTRRYNNQFFSVSFSYKFGKMEFLEKNKKDDEQEDNNDASQNADNHGH